ncbi:isochorismatase hydrolase [Bisporella sp. PMI_857]|nr:isochorismatase hydrolase [Bisporella sp. PMI_857]KAH8600583.1 isochorismatase hydrolase [Bisporella sp. PMI_857]
MKSAATTKTALLLIDIQKGFLHPTECRAFLSASRTFNASIPSAENRKEVLICHIHHHSIYRDSMLHPDQTVEVDGVVRSAIEALEFVKPREGERVFVKNVNSGFVGTGLEGFLRENFVRQLVIYGLTTDQCVSTTTRMANNLRVVDLVTEKGEVEEEGDILLVGDACATYDRGEFNAETVHRVNLASLNGEFASVKGTEEVVKGVFGV